MTIRPPDKTTFMNFSRLLERHYFAEDLFTTVNTYSAENGLVCQSVTIVDTTLLDAPFRQKTNLKKLFHSPHPNPPFKGRGDRTSSELSIKSLTITKRMKNCFYI
jgi:hypothetical protein